VNRGHAESNDPHKKVPVTKGEHVMTDDFFVSAQTNINEFDIKQLTKEKKKRLKVMEVDAEARAVLVKRSFAVQTSAFDSLNKTELDCLLHWHGVVPGAKMLKETKVSKLKCIFESNPNPPPRDFWTTSAEFEGDGDILGGYCHREEEDCTGAAAKCCNIEHVTDEVE